MVKFTIHGLSGVFTAVLQKPLTLWWLKTHPPTTQGMKAIIERAVFVFMGQNSAVYTVAVAFNLRIHPLRRRCLQSTSAKGNLICPLKKSPCCHVHSVVAKQFTFMTMGCTGTKVWLAESAV
jgi:hypothetical protein